MSSIPYPNLSYSFVVTLYNDGYLAPAFCREFLAVFQSYLNKQKIEDDVELIFVNDGSSDDTLTQVKKLAVEFPFVKVIDLSRNFGQHTAIICGYHHASGRYVGRLNVDMQDPPREIPKLLDVIRNEDVDIAVGLLQLRQSKWIDLITSRIFFWIFNALIGGKIPHNTATLRVMNRRYVDSFKKVHDKFPFLQGLETWMGFKVKYVPTDHQPRLDKRSSYTFLKRLKLAANASISFSDRPLQATVYIGLIIALLGFAGLALVVAHRLMVPDMPMGYASTMAVILFCSGIQIIVIGLSGLYIGKILTHVQDRPLYLVREKINFIAE